MPIYEYKCNDCGHKFTELVQMDADAPDCPNCGNKNISKLVSQIAGSSSACSSCISGSCERCGE